MVGTILYVYEKIEQERSIFVNIYVFQQHSTYTKTAIFLLCFGEHCLMLFGQNALLFKAGHSLTRALHTKLNLSLSFYPQLLLSKYHMTAYLSMSQKIQQYNYNLVYIFFYGDMEYFDVMPLKKNWGRISINQIMAQVSDFQIEV